MCSIKALLATALLTVAHVEAQAPLNVEQSTGFNSSFALSTSQIESANLSSTAANNINIAINFDRSQLANGGPAEDSFYELPPLSGTPVPGTLLKVQEFTNTSYFVIPPNTALSRILYTTSNLNGTVVPASAFILWPFTPKRFQAGNYSASTKAPAVVWTHGTEGFFASAGPSTHRALWYGHDGPFALALAGYAVVAPDYAGLGIHKSWDGSDIPHQYLMSQTSGHDALYALQASLEAFPEVLDERFVVMGHSQGGGVAWGVAEVLEAKGDGEFKRLAKGYLGTIAASPTTNAFIGQIEYLLPWIGMILPSIFPDFNISAWLTPLGIARTKLLQEVEGGIAVSTQLFLSGDKIIQDDYDKTWYVDAYGKLANAGGKPFKGPLLVIHGTEDYYIPENATATTVQATCEAVPEGDLEYLVVNGTWHVPTLDATRQTWLKWIEDRFEGRALEKTGCVKSSLESFLPLERYQATGKSFPQFAGLPEFNYQVPLGL
ncbi:putative secretory lipase [Daldinia caldariorum]|uniref:putative secretory lipase n=1 Tax=Daldinia caldariorum TaxID=326644 RepID=UPI00200721F0|nr:putative secretory lipase [Daldinia caldariorum]KAI1466590.1 putative secretory lipase [Daldinia caldariorum]